MVPSKVLNHVHQSLSFCTIVSIIGIKASPIVIKTPSKALPKLVNAPCKLSCITSAISPALPLELSILSASLSKSSSLAFTIALHADIASFPKIADKAAACSVSESPPIFSLKFSMVSLRFTVPSSFSFKEMPYCCIAACIVLVGFTRLTSPAFNAVPAWLPFIPLLPIIPIAKDKSSMLIPNVPAIGPTYFNVSPINSTLVFAPVIVAAITSVNLPVSSALIFKPLMASETISQVIPRSVPAAAAKFKVFGIAAKIFSVSYPAIPKYFIPSAA